MRLNKIWMSLKKDTESKKKKEDNVGKTPMAHLYLEIMFTWGSMFLIHSTTIF